MSESFIKKPVAGLLLLAGAAGGPYMLFETDAGQQARDSTAEILGGSDGVPGGWFTSSHSAGESTPNGDAPLLNPSSNPLNSSGDANSLTPTPFHSLGEVLRFDITAAWITQRFPRVSTVLADTQLDGLRVPLVTGTAPSDIAGTLTYYFDRYKRLQRITLHGVTGDPTRFIKELQQVYQMQQEPSLGGGLYLLTWNGRPTSILHVTPAAVIYADAPYSRYNMLIELNQPGLEYGLSAESRQLIEAGKQTQRW